MNLVISNKSEKPIYEQIYEQIASQVINGNLEANYCLPSIRNIALELNISVITIKRAWELLEQNGFIYTMAGKGCFVTEHKREQLEDVRLKLAQEKLIVEIDYYKALGLTLDELIELIKILY